METRCKSVKPDRYDLVKIKLYRRKKRARQPRALEAPEHEYKAGIQQKAHYVKNKHYRKTEYRKYYKIYTVQKKAGKIKSSNDFIKSLEEHLVDEDEMGAHFAFLDKPYTWAMIPVPQHVATM